MSALSQQFAAFPNHKAGFLYVWTTLSHQPCAVTFELAQRAVCDQIDHSVLWHVVEQVPATLVGAMLNVLESGIAVSLFLSAEMHVQVD